MNILLCLHISQGSLRSPLTQVFILYVVRTDEMNTFFINDLIQLYYRRHVSKNQMFILRKTCTCSFMVYFHASLWLVKFIYYVLTKDNMTACLDN